ncbi:4a-hydroxytetrahydrobiopterin dehydratase [Pontibacillus salicampi]|uniref:Putative pterin-4-alpha-carbinolamine dehydratase n=1 Tax=Pontibacillus salicampi TaxID=1449801 RepID=A0ABV6LQS1_9BACI
MSTLTEQQINQHLREIQEWNLTNDRFIQRTFTFAEYMDGIRFVHEIGSIADEKDHHPSLQVEYGKIIVSLTSHDVGGLSERDFDLAQTIDRVYQKRDE